MVENCILTKNVKIYEFFMNINTLLRQDSFKVIVFYTFYWNIQVFLAFTNTALNDVETRFFFLAIFSMFQKRFKVLKNK